MSTHGNCAHLSSVPAVQQRGSRQGLAPRPPLLPDSGSAYRGIDEEWASDSLFPRVATRHIPLRVGMVANCCKKRCGLSVARCRLVRRGGSTRQGVATRGVVASKAAWRYDLN